jgi:hypothetical protein
MLSMAGTGDLADNDNPGKLCTFRFADLRHSGQLSLVVSYDGGGTADCNYVKIFDKGPVGIANYDFDATQDLSLDSIKDLNGDGHDELIMDSGLAGGGGADHCVATWPVVYAWNGTGYADVSTEFKGYYRKTLAGLKRQIIPQSSPTPASAQEITEGELDGYNGVRARVRIIRPRAAPAPPPDAALGTDCLRAEAAKIERFLGVCPRNITC